MKNSFKKSFTEGIIKGINKGIIKYSSVLLFKISRIDFLSAAVHQFLLAINFFKCVFF